MPHLLSFLLLALGVFSTLLADSFPSGFTAETVASGLSLPTSLAFASGNRVFIATRSGVVRLVVNGVLQPQPFVDISSETAAKSDRGLLGIAVHPNFPSDPYVYLLHTYDPPGVAADSLGARVSRLVRVTADGAQGYNVALTSAASRVVLLGKNSTLANSGDVNNSDNTNLVACQTGPAGTATYVEDCIPSDSDTHSIGTVLFGADGRLYVGTGDAASDVVDPRALRVLDLDSMAGKIFRIDASTGQGLSDNPFYDGNPNSNRSRVYSYGMRNPFRFTQHPSTQALYIGDVGWNDWEEINTGRGRNFGWPCYEGGGGTSLQQASYATGTATSTRCQQLYAQGLGAVQSPLISYSHNGSGAAVILGPVYTGTSYPDAYRNALFYADFNSGDLHAAKLDGSGNVVSDGLIGHVSATTGLFAAPGGDIYYINYGDGTGTVSRLRFAGSAPTAVISATPSSGAAPLTVNFNGSGSTDPDNQVLTYAWDFGTGGATSTAANPTFTYNTAGSYTARLTVTDPTGLSSTAQVTIVAGAPPVVTITSPAVGTTYAVGDTIRFSGTATDLQDGSLSNSLRWTVALHHNQHVHLDIITLPTAASSGSFVVPDHGQNTYLTLCATSVDSTGLSAQACRDLLPRTVTYTFNTSPQGLQVVYDGSSFTAPYTAANAIVNSQVDVSVPTPQQTCLRFTSWSDGNTNSARQLLIGSASATLTASFDSSQCGGSSDLLGYWKFDEGGGSFAADSSGNGNTAALFSTGWAAGRSGTAANFYGDSNSHVRIPASGSFNSITNQITVSAWVHPNTIPSGRATIAARQSGAGANNQWALASDGGHPVFVIRSGTSEQNVTASATVSAGQWYHVAGTYDGVNMRLYVNGAQVGSLAKSGNITLETGKEVLLGGSQVDTSTSVAGLLFDGYVDEVRLHRRALSASEVQALFNAFGQPPANVPPTVSISSPANNAVFVTPANIQITASASDPDGSIAKVEFYNGSTKLGEATSSPYQFTWTNVGIGAYQITARAIDNLGAATNSASVNVNVNGNGGGGGGGSTGLVGRWKFDEASGSTAADSSGAGNTARLVNAGWWEGRAGSSVNLFGFNRSHVRIPNSTSLNHFTNAMTLAAWVRRDADQFGRISVMTRQFGNGTANVFFLGFNNNRYSFRLTTSAGEREVLDGTAPTFAWIHMVVTYDGSTMRLYVNGVQTATASQSGNIVTDTKPILIGGNQNDTISDNADLLMNGRVDDARIYDRVLTASEVRALYDLGAK